MAPEIGDRVTLTYGIDQSADNLTEFEVTGRTFYIAQHRAGQKSHEKKDQASLIFMVKRLAKPQLI
jgi:hypothetical protein